MYTYGHKLNENAKEIKQIEKPRSKHSSFFLEICRTAKKVKWYLPDYISFQKMTFYVNESTVK